MNRYRHYETDPAAIERHLEFFAKIPAQHKPANLERIDSYNYEYDFVEGGQIVSQGSLNRLFELCMLHVWKPRAGDQGKEAVAYVEYVLRRAREFGLKNCLHRTTCAILDNRASLTLSEMHGDLTLENVIQSDDLVFIDPGMPRGLSCRELDEAKILQSVLTKWDILNRSTSAYWLTAPFQVTDLHLALLVTHWVRLACHQERHSSDILKHAGAVIDYLEGLL